MISLRKGRNRLALWTRSSQDRGLALRVRGEWRKMLPVSNAVKLGFVSHSQTMKGGKTSYDMQPAVSEDCGADGRKGGGTTFRGRILGARARLSRCQPCSLYSLFLLCCVRLCVRLQYTV